MKKAGTDNCDADFYLAEFSHCANVLEEKSVFVDDQHVLHLQRADGHDADIDKGNEKDVGSVAMIKMIQ